MVTCIHNGDHIPRTLFKNGKRSKNYISNSVTFQVFPNSDSVPSENSDSNSHASTSTPQENSNPDHPSSFTESSTLPTANDVSTHFVTREFNFVKDEIRSMKSDIAALSHNHQSAPTDVVGEEIMFLKRELASLQDTVM